MILSGGVLVKSPTTIWQGSPATFPGWDQITLTGDRWSSYGEIYRKQQWVATVVNKLAMGTARLPLKVYERDELNRPQVPDHPYSVLLNNPNPTMSRFAFWLWVSSTFDIYGEAFLLKIRDSGGRPIMLAPLHPSCMHPRDERDEEVLWDFQNGRVKIEGIRQSDLVQPRTYNPESMHRGLSKLEPLSRTLEFEDAAQRAQSSFWRKGARPGVALSHPGNISQPAIDRLKLQWDNVAAGADNTGTTVILEEGMKPEVMTLSNNEAQYIESRKLNREEVCAVYDVPPPAVHILDRATFSNITEQMRSLYRDTHAPRLQLFEGCLETELRASVRPGASEPDFGDDVYAEFLLDEVLRGDFEARAAAYQAADWMTMAEKRKAENKPFIEGTDQIYVNAATVPLKTGEDEQKLTPSDLALMLQKIYLAVGVVLSPDEARELMNMAGADLEGPAPVPATSVRGLMGQLSRVDTLTAVDPKALTASLDPSAALLVKAVLSAAVVAGSTVPQFRDRLRAIGGSS